MKIITRRRVLASKGLLGSPDSGNVFTRGIESNISDTISELLSMSSCMSCVVWAPRQLY